MLEQTTVELPEPGPGEVAVDVEWIGLNRAEILWREGRYLVRPELPAPIGLECAGVVLDTGDPSVRFAPGDRVGVVPGTFDPRKYGTYADTIVVPARSLLPTPGELDGPATAAVWMAYLTAWGGLLDVGQLEEGWHVVIPAASSSVGTAAIQLCLHEEAVPIAVTTRPEKAAALRELGVEHVIVSSSDDVVERVLEITDGAGARLFFDPVGGALLGQEIRCAAPGARIVVYGMLDQTPATIDTAGLIARGARIEGYLLPRTTGDPQVFDVAVGQIVDAISNGEVEPVVDRVFRFGEIAEAHRYMEAGSQVGKVVVGVH